VGLPDPSEKAALSVAEVAGLCLLSRSRFAALVKAGVFPPPARRPPCKRPFYPREVALKCVEIRRTGIGLAGQVVLFNRKPASRQKAASPPAPVVPPEVLEAVRSLGLAVTPQAVAGAVAALYPDGLAGLDQGDVIRQVFLHLQGGKK